MMRKMSSLGQLLLFIGHKYKEQSQYFVKCQNNHSIKFLGSELLLCYFISYLDFLGLGQRVRNKAFLTLFQLGTQFNLKIDTWMIRNNRLWKKITLCAWGKRKIVDPLHIFGHFFAISVQKYGHMLSNVKNNHSIKFLGSDLYGKMCWLSLCVVTSNVMPLSI